MTNEHGHPSPSTSLRASPIGIIRLFLVIFIILAIPLITLVLGQIARRQINADVACKRPAIPDPADCVGGEWKISKDINGCIHFVCTPR